MAKSNITKVNKRSADWLVGRILLGLYFILSIIFIVALFLLHLLPARYLCLLCVIFLLVGVSVALLIWKPKYHYRFIIGLVIGVICIINLSIGNFYIIRTHQTASIITTTKVESAAVGIYVRANDSNDFSMLAESYTYGVLSNQDRDNTNEAIARISSDYGFDPNIKEYDVLTLLIDGLLSNEVDAIIINSAYIDLLDDIEGYEDTASQLQEVTVQHIERQIEVDISQDADAEKDLENEEPSERLSGNVVEDEELALDASVDDQQGMIFTVYLSGIDNRGDLIEKSRCDTNILASVNTATKQVALISTPRDYYVPLPIADGAMDKLTHAGIYGVNASMDTLAALYNVNIDYYFRVNFAGFEKIVDTLGGVTVNSEVAFSVDDYNFSVGPNDVDGKGALLFCRVRTAFASGDRQRGRNQLAMMRAIINKAMSPALLVNYDSILYACQSSFETSIPYDVVSSIVREQLDEGGEWNIVTYSVNGEGAGRTPFSTGVHSYVMIPYQDTVDTAKYLIWQVYTGQIVAAP